MFQRQVISTQLVSGHIDQTQDSVVKTVGGRTLVIKIQDSVTTVNDVTVDKVITVGDNQLWVLSKLLFIRLEDIEIGASRVRGDAT